MDCLVAYTHADHDLMLPSGKDNPGGGVAIKYARCATIPGKHQFRIITSIAEIESDVVFADWFWFSKTFMDYEDFDYDQRIDQFLNLDVRFKGISGMELSMMGWPDKRRRRLIEGVDVITHVNEYQRQLYRYCGIEDSKLLADPVPETVFYPAQKSPRLVCVGQISSCKRSHLVAELFEGLKASDIQTCYIGSSSSWGRLIHDTADKALEKRIKNAADLFLGSLPQAEVAYYMNQSMFGAHVAWHDVAPIWQRENTMAGNVTFALTHPALKKVPAYRYKTIEEMIRGIRSYPMKKFDKDSEKARKFAVKTNSYAAWQKQLLSIVYPTSEIKGAR